MPGGATIRPAGRLPSVEPSSIDRSPEARMTTTSPVHADAGTTTTPPGPTRIRVVAAALAASTVTVAGLLATTPWGDRLDSSADDVLSYDKLLDVRDAAWSSMLLDSFAYAVIGMTLGLGVLHLVRSKGRIAALVGAVLTTAGGILFAMGGAAFATVVWFITADGLSDGAGQSLVDYANDHAGHLMGIDMAGFVLTTVGSLVLATALIRARAVPVPAVVAYLLLTILQFIGLQGRVIDFLQIVIIALLLAFGVVGWRRAQVRFGGSGKKLDVRAAYSG